MIIVTGGAGFIGSNLVKILNDQGENKIIIVDNIGKTNKFLNLNKLKFIDYFDKETFLTNFKHFKEVKTIFHEGACSVTTELDGNYMIKNNYVFSKELLDIALINKSDFIYASSASVYGDGKNGFKEEPQYEYPLNVYAFSKLMFDNHVRNIFKHEKNLPIQITGLRYFNVFGYQENHKGNMASVIFHFYNQRKNNEAIKLFEGSEKYLRDFIFIEDVINVNMFFYEKKINGIYNCGTGKARSFYDMASIFKDTIPNTQIKIIPFPDNLKGKYQAYTQADLENLKKCGYQKSFLSLKEGVKKYLDKLTSTNGFF